MNCGEYELLISAYADGELTSAEKTDVQAHIGRCDNCRRLYEDTVCLHGRITHVLAASPEDPDLVSVVMGQIRPRRARFAWVWAAAAALVLLMIGGSKLMQRTHESQPAPVVAVVRPGQKPVPERQMVAPRSGGTALEAIGVSGTRSRNLIGTVAGHAGKIRFATEVPKHRPHSPITGVAKENPNAQIPAQGENATPPVVAERAEIAVTYTASAPAALRNSDLAALLLAQAPVAGPGQQVVAQTETVIGNGKRFEMMCYRIIHDSGEND